MVKKRQIIEILLLKKIWWTIMQIGFHFFFSGENLGVKY